MKKQKIVILIIASIIYLTGCGRKEEEITQGPVEIDVLINKEDPEEMSSENEEEIVPETPVKFDCFDEIKNASPDSGLVQIDDMILQYGATGAELFEAINQSECEYTFECNENQLVPGKDAEMVYFHKNGESYFGIRFDNIGTETVELKDCVIDIICIFETAKENVYYAGASGEIETYSSVKEIMSNYEPEREYTNHKSGDDKRLAVLYKIPDSSNIVDSFEDELYIYYIFDANTSELNSFQIVITVSICRFRGRK